MSARAHLEVFGDEFVDFPVLGLWREGALWLVVLEQRLLLLAGSLVLPDQPDPLRELVVQVLVLVDSMCVSWFGRILVDMLLLVAGFLVPIVKPLNEGLLVDHVLVMGFGFF